MSRRLTSTIQDTRTVRWLFGLAMAALLMIQPACVTSGPSGLPPSDILEKWDGTWAMTEQGGIDAYVDCCEGPGENIPLTPKARQLRDDYAAIPFTSAAMNTEANLPNCISPGMPGIFRHPLLFDFTWGPGHVRINFEDGSIRRIWTDGRSFPERLLPKRLGTSIAHWEGSTLVVETRGISRQSEIMMMGPLRPGPQTKVTERFTVIEESIKAVDAPDFVVNPADPIARHLHLQTTVEDPEMFFEPYIYDDSFINVPISFETGCRANNRSIGDAPVDLTPPEDD